MDYFEAITQKLHNKESVFLTGGAGVGKTTITKKVIEHFEQEAKKVAKLASTGMAATLIGGQTLHSFFEFGIAQNRDELVRDGKGEPSKKLKKLITSLFLIVIDEISMVSDTLFEMVTMRLEQCAFGGALLVVGDFLQLPPVVRRGEVCFAFESEAWRACMFERIELTHIYRTTDAHFIELLHKVRFGEVDEEVHDALNAFIKPLPHDFNDVTFLFGLNQSAQRHNKEQLGRLDGELYAKEAQIIKHKKTLSDTEVERFMSDARIERLLELKVGAPVLFSKNSWNYFNGERGEIVAIDASYVYVKKSDAKVVKLEQVAQSKMAWAERIHEGKKELVEEPVMTLYQYPIKLAYAITIHKSQGMSILDLVIATNEIFAPSQFYVALSRAMQPARLTLLAPKGQWYEKIFVHPKALEFTMS